VALFTSRLMLTSLAGDRNRLCSASANIIGLTMRSRRRPWRLRRRSAHQAHLARVLHAPNGKASAAWDMVIGCDISRRPALVSVLDSRFRRPIAESKGAPLRTIAARLKGFTPQDRMKTGRSRLEAGVPPPTGGLRAGLRLPIARKAKPGEADEHHGPG
jgi:hypothetical protein